MVDHLKICIHVHLFVCFLVLFWCLLVCLCHFFLHFLCSHCFFLLDTEGLLFLLFFFFTCHLSYFFIPSPQLVLSFCVFPNIFSTSTSLPLFAPFLSLFTFPCPLAVTVDRSDMTRTADVYPFLFCHKLFTSEYHKYQL